MRRIALLPTALLVIVALIAVPAVGDDDGHDGHRHLGEVAGGPLGALDDGSVLFWEAPHIACSGDPSPDGISAPPTCDQGEAFSWTLVVVDDDADVLRVDFDHAYRQDDFTLVVTMPDGETVEKASHNTYSEGVVISDPAEGTYEVTVQVVRTAGAIVRVRAGLLEVDDDRDDDGGEPLLPNLRTTPPFEIGFAAPINPTNSTFFAGDDQNPGVIVGGRALYSCTPDEVQEVADPTRNPDPSVLTRCLRFTTGPHNVGQGHFDLRFPIPDRLVEDRDRLVEMTQHVHRTDGTTSERPAGTYEYHATHGHWHYTDILFYELLWVDPATRTTTPVGVGHKSGFCPGDQGYGEWRSLDQQPNGAVNATRSGSCIIVRSQLDGAMGLTAGWGDYYRWQRPGQFVDFSGQPDGEYVIRATVDVLDNVLESDESDNASYAHVRVTGDQVEILERGYGDSPFDPDKVLADDHRGQYPIAALDDAVMQ